MNNQESTSNNRAEDVDAYNQNSLEELAWAIEAGEGEFSLLLARCDYTQLRDSLTQQLQSISQIQITELRLDPSDITLYSKIRDLVKQEQPEALMITGLESVKNLAELLRATNQVREEFRKNFPFPLLLWINDEVQEQLKQLAFDFKDWATTVKFALPANLLVEELQKKVDSLFAETLQSGFDSFVTNEEILGDNYCQELEAAFTDLAGLAQELPANLKAGCDFIRGRTEYINNNFAKALEYFNNSLAFWQGEKSNSLLEQYSLRESNLQFHIGLCYSRQGSRENQPEKWQEAKESFQQCLAIFEQLERTDLVAKFINSLAEVLAILEEWSELDNLAQKALYLHKTYDEQVYLAEDYGFLALVALKKTHYKEAKEHASLALEKTKAVPLIKQKYQSLYYLLLAQAQEYLGQHQESVKAQEAAAALEDKGNISLYLSLLAQLQALYFKNDHFIDAYQVKQERITIEQQSGLIAFVGANRLKKTIKGRKTDVDALVTRIAGDRYKTIIIYGQSGVGKSSLVEAELIPTLQQKKRVGLRDLLVVYQRFYSNWEQELAKGLSLGLGEWQGNGKQGELREQVGKGGEIFSAEIASLENIFEQLSQNDAQRNLLTVLIFDQFEEFFFVCQTPEARQKFFQFFSRCLTLPFIKIILSLREDYLHLILQGTRRIDLSNINNDILDKDILYYVGNFSTEQAKEVIRALTEATPFSLDSDLIERLVQQDLTNEFGEIRPIELQVVGAQLQAEKICTLEEYEQLGDTPKETLIQKYLQAVIQDCGSENQKIAELVLSLLVDETNRTRPLKTRPELEQELTSLSIDTRNISEQLSVVLEIFVLSGLVFRLPESPENRYQLIHDYLVDVILQQQGSLTLAKLKQAKEQKRLAEAKFKLLLQRSLIGSAVAIVILTISTFYAVRFALQVKEGEVINLSQSSRTLYNSNQQTLEPLIEALKAGKKLKQAFFAKAETRTEAIIALKQALSGVKEHNRLTGHEDSVRGVAFSRDGQTLATASYDETVKLWNLQGEEILTLTGHKEPVTGLAFSPDSQTLASASRDQTIKLWNLQGEELLTLTGHKTSVIGVAFSPDGQTLASASEDGTVKLWNLQGEELITLTGHEDWVYGVAFSPDGQTLATTSGDGTVKLWNLQGEELLTFTGHEIGIISLAFSPDGQTLATASGDQTVKLWNLQGEELFTFTGHKDIVYGVAFSPDGQTLATASVDQTVKLWNLQGEALLTFTGHKDIVYSAAFSPDGQTLATASYDETVKLWNLQGEELLNLSGHKGIVYGVAFSPDGQTLATASYDETVKLWNFNLDFLLEQGCNWVGDYLKYNPKVNPNDKLLCDGISQ